MQIKNLLTFFIGIRLFLLLLPFQLAFYLTAKLILIPSVAIVLYDGSSNTNDLMENAASELEVERTATMLAKVKFYLFHAMPSDFAEHRRREMKWRDGMCRAVEEAGGDGRESGLRQLGTETEWQSRLTDSYLYPRCCCCLFEEETS